MVFTTDASEEDIKIEIINAMRVKVIERWKLQVYAHFERMRLLRLSNEEKLYFRCHEDCKL